MTNVCDRLHRLCNSLPRQRFPFDESRVPENGIYILFEQGEYGHGADRIVRVGTHNGARRLRSRLIEHFINENKDRSIFRKNIGRALLNQAHDPFLEQWEWDLTEKVAKARYKPLLDFQKQRAVEEKVSATIRSHFSFVVFPVEDKDQRLEWEEKLISTIFSCSECGPSPDWLGYHSPKEKIRASGLWLVQGLSGHGLSADELEKLEMLTQDSY